MRDLKWGEAHRTAQVCIDSYEEGVFSGRFYHPIRPEGESFRSLSQFLLKMEALFDEMARPQADTEVRTFGVCTSPPPEKPDPSQEVKGLLATFRLRVLFRQHSSWQGEVIWTEQAKYQCFRSVMELIHLLDSALRREEAV